MWNSGEAIVALKGVQLAVFGMKCIDLHNQAVNICGTSHATTQ